MSEKRMIPEWRRDQIKDVVLDILEKSKVGELPVDLQAILKALNLRCVTYEFAEANGVKVEGTEDGYTIARSTKNGFQYMIVYNHNITVRQRIRWTIAHEIGHIVLGHTDGKYIEGDKEAEANYFARELLAPLAVLDELGARTATAISSTCDISKEAAEIRTGDFARRDRYKLKYGNTERDIRFIQQFSKKFETEFALEFSFDISIAA